MTTTTKRGWIGPEEQPEPLASHLLDVLRRTVSVFAEQRDDNGELFAEGNAELFEELRGLLGFVDAAHFASGTVTFHEDGRQL